MKNNIVRLIGKAAGTAALLPLVLGTAHAAYYAKTISSTTVYSLEAATPNSGIVSSTFWQGGTNLAGIATHGQYAFVSDNTASGAALHVLHLGGAYIGKIDLSGGVQSAGAVSVDDNGRVYVADVAQNGDARYAVVYAPNWSSPTEGLNRVYGGVPGNWQIDLAAYSSGAIIVRRNDDLNPYGEIGGTAATTINSTGTSNDRGIVVGDPAIPAAVATDRDGGNAYILSNSTTLNENFDYVQTATLSARSSSWTSMGSLSFGGAVAHDLAFMNDGGVGFIGMVGIANGGLQAWKIGLDAGSPQQAYSTMAVSDDQSATHQVAASSDGRMLWVTAQASGTVYGLDYGNWGAFHPSVGSLALGDQINAIAVHDYVVPEPSSVVSLLAMGAGMFGFWRRRK